MNTGDFYGDLAKLTFNFGLRYDLFNPLQDIHHASHTLDSGNPSAPAFISMLDPIWQISRRDFSPRIGFAHSDPEQRRAVGTADAGGGTEIQRAKSGTEFVVQHQRIRAEHVGVSRLASQPDRGSPKDMRCTSARSSSMRSTRHKFANPDGDGAFGQVTSTSLPNREIQFGLKYQF